MKPRKEKEQGMRRLQSEMDRMLLELTGSRMYGCPSCGFRPNVDVYYSKAENALIVKMELAGVDPGDVELEARDSLLRVHGHRRDTGHKDKVYQQMEIGYGTFERRLRLPLDVDVNQAAAEYQDGFLLITLPVNVSESRRIPIRQDGEEEAGQQAGRGTVEATPETD